MSAVPIISTIQLILAPVVMLSACAILQNSILLRYAAINDRLRAMTSERLELLRTSSGRLSRTLEEGKESADTYAAERLTEIDHQMPELIQRHALAHYSALTIYGAILLLILDMFVIALATLLHSGALAVTELLVFLLGVAVLLVGILLIAQEVRTSHRAIMYEAQRVLRLGDTK